MTAKDEGYYSIELNRHSSKPKSDAATQTYLREGLLKGSTSQLMEAGHRVTPAERPKTLRKLKNVYENVARDGNNGTIEDSGNGATVNYGADKSLSILSPFDEQEEWAKISEIMASFSSGLVRDSMFVAEMEKEIQARLSLSSLKKAEESPKIGSKVGQWLHTMNLSQFESVFLDNGYDDLDFLNGTLDEEELKFLGLSDKDLAIILPELENLPNKIIVVQKQYPLNNHNNNNSNTSYSNSNNNNNVTDDENGEMMSYGEEEDDANKREKGSEVVDRWLDSIHLGIYKDTFRRHLYLDMQRVKRIWEVELTAVLEIMKRGHRRRILASVNSPIRGNAASRTNLEEITADLSQLKSNIEQLKDEIREKLPANLSSPTSEQPSNSVLAPTAPNTGTLRHSHKKNKPAPPPPIATDGSAPSKLSPAPELPIRNPSELLVGVPSTLTTQWRHRPEELVAGNITYVANYLGSTVVKELKGTESTKKSIQKLKKTSKELTTTPDIMLAISYRGVKFLNTGTQELVCEHEIRNIHCACQDADDLTHFAYITKDHISRSHYCHVFCVETMDQATEVILTLGQAFEVAYQITLREQFAGNRRAGGHTRSQSTNQIVTLSTKNSKHQQQQPTQPQQQQSNHSRSLSVNEMKVKDNSEENKVQEEDKAPLVHNEDL